MPVAATALMLSAVMYDAQWSWRASAAPSIDENVHSSVAFSKAPVKRSWVIHDSRMSQPPRFTPRRKGISGSDEAVAVAEVVVVFFVEILVDVKRYIEDEFLEALDVCAVTVGIFEVLEKPEANDVEICLVVFILVEPGARVLFQNPVDCAERLALPTEPPVERVLDECPLPAPVDLVEPEASKVVNVKL